DAIKTREDAEAAMADAAPDPSVRAFLLQNLRREGSGWRWQANLDVIGRDLDALSGWPPDLAEAAPYPGPVLWMAGATSNYISEESSPPMRRFFPRVQKITIKGAGHWVHSDQPGIFLDVLSAFLAR
ncbi:MAG TPA: alpha/beta fold hydrolase, partial [Marmoricola sp.]|nr:alpha/beta fold hydrolase [Marmoricola sp.]